MMPSSKKMKCAMSGSGEASGESLRLLEKAVTELAFGGSALGSGFGQGGFIPLGLGPGLRVSMNRERPP